MNNNYEKFRAKVFSAMRGLAKDCPEFSDAEMLVASSDVTASLKRSTVHKSIDTEWVDRIEHTLPYLDLIVRNPTIMIEDVDEILPVELSRNIGEKTIKHLAQHTNMILNITEDDEVIPQKLLNVFHEESLLTYENKFINTLLVRLSVFVDKRYKLLRGGYGTERKYQFRYATEFEHYASEESGRNLAKVQLSIDLASPITVNLSEPDLEANDRYKMTLARVQKISNALMSYMSSPYVRTLGRNYIRPPVIRTNAILKNKNMKECLNLWEYIESFDKAGYSFVSDEFTEMPSDNYISDLYSSVALQYTDFYNGVAENPEDNRILANRHLSEVYPDFDSSFDLEDLEDYRVYDTEYKKTVPVSRLMNNRKKLSEDERRIRLAIIVALKADELINAEELEREAEERRLAREKRRIEEEERRRAEEEARRRAEEEARRQAEEEEARRRAEAEARGPVVIRYRRSFLARYIQAGSFLQDYYNEIKNDLLSYKGVKSRISWNKETYKRGRQPIAKMDVKGKTLYLWLAMNPIEFENSKYHVTDVSDQRIGEEYPLQMKVRSPRSMKYAKELIAILMERLEIPRIEREFEDFHLPYRETEELIELGLIKVILPAGVTLDEHTQTVKADLRDVFGEGSSGDGEAGSRENEPRVTMYEGGSSEYEAPVADGEASATEYEETVAEGEESATEYEETVAEGEESATEYEETVAEGEESATEYEETVAEGEGSATEYEETVAEGEGSATEYEETVAEGEGSATEYEETVADGEGSVIEYEESATEEAEEAIPALNRWEESDGSEQETATEEESDSDEWGTVGEEELTPAVWESEATEEPVADGEQEEQQPVEEPAPVEADVEEPFAAMSEMEENSLAMVIDQVINSSGEDSGEQYTIVNVSGTARIVRKKASDKNDEFSYAGAEGDVADETAVVIPYTRAQYLALPRKKKKSVLMNVKKMISYRNTRAMLDLLCSMNTQNPRILERIQLLEERLATEAKYLPTAPLWEESVKRLKK